MCLAVPTRVEELLDENRAVVELGGVKREIGLDLLEDVQVGDYVIVHVGYALEKLDPEEARQTLELFARMEDHFAREAGQSEDPDGTPDP